MSVDVCLAGKPEKINIIPLLLCGLLSSIAVCFKVISIHRDFFSSSVFNSFCNPCTSKERLRSGLKIFLLPSLQVQL